MWGRLNALLGDVRLALPDEDAAQNIAEHFGEFMTFILQSQSLMSAMTQQTLRIQQGLDQVEPRGLQDPMYEP